MGSQIDLLIVRKDQAIITSDDLFIDFIQTWNYNIFCVVLSFFIMSKE